MNELEKKIIERCKDCKGDYLLQPDDAFNLGCNFIQELNLPAKFGNWLFDNFLKNEHGYKRKDPFYKMDIDDMSDPFTIEFLEFYWINNVYGK